MFRSQIDKITLSTPSSSHRTLAAYVFHEVNGNKLVTEHVIDNNVLGLGRFIDETAFINKVNQHTHSTRGELLPHNVLINDQNSLVWFTERQCRHLWFKVHSHAPMQIRCHIPPLLFSVKHGQRSLNVFAMATNKRPTRTTRLYLAPFMNVSNDGHLCQGNAPLPSNVSVDSIPDIEKTLLDSSFTHLNYKLNSKHHHYTGNDKHLDFWQAKQGKRLFAHEMPFYKTLGQFIEDL
ncbi:hypothetical protein [Thalassotalea marina]|uniref:PRTRC system protein B n=1 Tax=Thalassotalea marina TaxID=1673741 RepID=A0A919BSW9_9GAMM|nr:hypothetical protein [Thalassotalea marina]GHG07720.1 hypothetical protein GCM10017161_41740 [Thalassotalea marina]